MKRDMDLIRRLLLAVEAMPVGTEITEETAPELVEADGPTTAEHVRLLIEAGLVNGDMEETLSDEEVGYCMNRLTWQGHDFLDAVRSDSIWSRVKQAAKERGLSLTFEVVKMLAVHFTAAQLGLGPSPPA